MVLVIDNYDSFVHNLARYFRVQGRQTKVVRNDEITLNNILELNPSHIVLSPGPCTPDKAGVCVDVVKTFSDKIPILGVCLGHQAIAQAFGANVVKLNTPMHGKSTSIEHNGRGMFSGLSSPLAVGRYHSLKVDEDGLDEAFEVNAKTDDGIIMAIAHKYFPVWGVQFHPESVLTEFGAQMIENFLRL